METSQMGVREWAQAWLAFKELPAFLDIGPGGWQTATEAGWLAKAGLFNNAKKILSKRISSSPHHFREAYGFNADIYVGRDVVMPEKLVEILATQRHTAPELMFSKTALATAIGQLCYDKGIDALRMEKNSNAVKWLLFAADQGNGNAQLALGRLHSEGKGLPQDRVLAHKWFNLAAASLTGEARKEAVTLRDKTSKVLTANQRAEAEVLARQWKQRSWEEIKATEPSVDDGSCIW
jgi:TPR repeat protein